MLVFYDAIVFIISALLILLFYGGNDRQTIPKFLIQVAVSVVCIFGSRFIGNIYKQVWRYGGIQCYIRLLITDFFAFFICLIVEVATPVARPAFGRMLSFYCVDLLGALAIRMVYRYAYKCCNEDNAKGRFLKFLLHVFAGMEGTVEHEPQKIKIAIIGAGRVGVSLARELEVSENSAYIPVCFIDASKEKVGREIQGIPVWSEDEATLKRLADVEVQEVIFAIPNMELEKKQKLYEYYKGAGYKLKVYDAPTMYQASGKMHLREFDVEDLLFRKQKIVADEHTADFYRGKTVLVTGGGGSIGSELSRQLSRMDLKKLVLLDIYENGVYDVQQELRMSAPDLDVAVEIVSITNKEGMRAVFNTYHPDIVINAAAHKHVPLMEHNCIEAIENNVFGTKNLVDLCEEFDTARFMMVSTDKAVNPTNVMGATKRMCEMIV